MNRQQAINYLKSSGLSQEQINTVVDALAPKGDLISRQDAIDVAKQHWYKPDIAKALEELPSATQWIPCSERLPEVGKMVLTINFHSQCNVLSITEFETWHDWDDCFVNDYIIAWMPLPELYREEQ